MSRPTPETDDQPTINAINDNGYQIPCVDIEFARKLERERDEWYFKAHENFKFTLDARAERDEARVERDILRLNLLGTIQLNIPVTTDWKEEAK